MAPPTSASASPSSVAMSLSTSGSAVTTHHTLDFGPGIGIGVAVGFVVALILAALSVWTARFYRNEYLIELAKFIVMVSPKRSLRKKLPKPVPNPFPEGHNRHFPDGRTDFRKAHHKEFGMNRQPVIYHVSTLKKTLRECNNGYMNIWRMAGGDYCNWAFFSNPISQSAVQALLDEEQLTRLAGKPVNDGTWVEQISNPKTRKAAIACFLSQVIVPRMHPTCDPSKTLLPPELVTYWHKLMNFSDHYPCNGPPTTLLWDRCAILREVIFDCYAQQFCINTNYAIHYFSHQEQDPRYERVMSLVHEIKDVLKLDILRGHDCPPTLVDSGLKEILENASNVGLILFCQPGEWRFDYLSDEPGFITFPGIRLDLDTWEVHLPPQLAHHLQSSLLKDWKNTRVSTEDLPEGKALLPP